MAENESKMNQTEKSVGEFVVTALVSYIATNADDLIILMNLFTEASIPSSSLKVRHVFIGQYLGFFVLLGVSLIGYGISYAMPVEMLGFLGFLPIILGIKGFIEIIVEMIKKSKSHIDAIKPDDGVSTVEVETNRSRTSIDGEIVSEYAYQRVEEKILPAPSTIPLQQKLVHILNSCFNIQTLKVAGITVANSGDNVAIYTPLFAQATRWQISAYMGIFLAMVLVWLLFSYFFINFRPVLSVAQQYARYMVPVVFVGIGIYIIGSSDCLPWLERAIASQSFKDSS